VDGSVLRARHFTFFSLLSGMCAFASVQCVGANPLQGVQSQVGAARVSSENGDIAARRAKERKDFSDAEITEGFFKIAFGAELHVGGRVDRIRKYEGPIRIFIDDRAKPDRRATVAAVVDDIRARVQHLDLQVIEDKHAANFIVTLVRDRDLSRTLVSFYGKKEADEIERRLKPQCLSSFRKDAEFRIQHSNAIIAVDVGDFKFYDCAYEELLQALGPINDDSSVPWTMFNDDVKMGFFDVYDQYVLNLLYDQRIQPGMTPEAVRKLLPEILPDVRAFVARTNSLAQ
jgi:hypothetical protein